MHVVSIMFKDSVCVKSSLIVLYSGYTSIMANLHLDNVNDQPGQILELFIIVLLNTPFNPCCTWASLVLT